MCVIDKSLTALNLRELRRVVKIALENEYITYSRNCKDEGLIPALKEEWKVEKLDEWINSM